MRPLRVPIVVSVLAVLAVSCTDPKSSAEKPDATTTTTSVEPTAPVGDAFYAGPQSLPKGKPGSMIWSQAIDAPNGAQGWRILYTSQSLEGADIVVSGVLFAPTGEPPAEGRPIVTWAHGTAGTADHCAPSKADAAKGIPALDRFLEQGYLVVATDYEGLGTPGLHPFLVGESEGRGVLDAARAVQGFPEAHAGNRVAIYGYSQGGHAALFAGQIAASYAPELKIVGDVAGAPVGDLKLLVPVSMNVAKFRGFALLVGLAYAAAHPDADAKEFVTPEVYALGVEKVEKECVSGVLKAFEDPAMTVFTKSPLDSELWSGLFSSNTPGNSKIGVPVLALQGLGDQLVPPAVTEAWMQRACALGTRIELKTYPGLDHGPAAEASAPDAATWISERFAGSPAVDGCVPGA